MQKCIGILSTTAFHRLRLQSSFSNTFFYLSFQCAVFLCFVAKKFQFKPNFDGYLGGLTVREPNGRELARRTKYPTLRASCGEVHRARAVLKSKFQFPFHLQRLTHFNCLRFWGHIAYVTVYTVHISFYVVSFRLRNKKWRPIQKPYEDCLLYGSVVQWSIEVYANNPNSSDANRREDERRSVNAVLHLSL